jgi:hypothetical protein
VLKEGSPNRAIYRTISRHDEDGGLVQYVQEKEKHEITKRALNKAIKLANLLLDEITRDQSSYSGKRSKLS